MSKKEDGLDKIEMVLLKRTNDRYELDTIKTLLDNSNIVYVLKDHGIGGYMRIVGGGSLYGTDILVEESTIEKAEAILNEFPWDAKK